MRLKLPEAFPDATPIRFRQDLERFAKETARFAEQADVLYESALSVSTTHGNVQAEFGKLTRVNPQGSSCIVYCPKAGDQDIGKRFEVTVFGSGSAVIQPIGATIDGETSVTITDSAKLVTVRWDGLGFVSNRQQCCGQLDWAIITTSMAPTFAAYLHRDFSQALPTLSVLGIRLPGRAAVAREWQMQRYGSTLGAAIPTPGPSGIATVAHSIIFALEVNRRVVATMGMATGLAYKTASLVASLNGYDQVAVVGNIPSGGVFNNREYWTSSLLLYGP